MPGKVKVRIVSGRHLPVMDRSSDTTDAFAEVKLGDTTYKTDVCRKSLNPCWNSEWFRFDVDDSDLQDEPLQIRIMDYDTYSANDAIGKVFIGLNPLLVSRSLLLSSSSASLGFEAGSNADQDAGGSNNVMSGWLPIFDTIHGIRGEVNVQVKVELFSDRNKFRQSSCGVPFFFTSGVPHGYRAHYVNGFVEELMVNDDPEYQWIDKIRTPRASNEARQTLFVKLSGAVQRKIGLKALEMGGNAVVGYQQRFDVEGDTGIVVVRGIGTAVSLVKNDEASASTRSRRSVHPADCDATVGCFSFKDPDNFLDASPPPPRDLELLEYPFVTMKQLPQGLVRRFGGLVSCRSVKLLDEGPDGGVRDGWWKEARREIRSHARALGCNLIVGYSEDAVISSDDVVVLCAAGTAVVGDLGRVLDLESGALFGPPFIPNDESVGGGGGSVDGGGCSVVHLPHDDDDDDAVTAGGRKCRICHKVKVPDVIFTTVEPPSELELDGRGCLVQAKVLRLKKDAKGGENNAKEISDGLPFVEYEIHRQLVNKLKVKGMNGLFGLKIRLSVGEKAIVATATATAAHVRALPRPCRPKLVTTRNDRRRLRVMQQRLEDKVVENGDFYGIPASDDGDADNVVGSEGFDTQQLATGNKDTCVLEIDDAEDADIVDSLMDRFPPANLQVFSTERLIGVAPDHVVRCCQTFSQIWRGRIHPSSSTDLSTACQKLLSLMYFKLRKLGPCIVASLDFKADLSEDNDLQLAVNGTAISLARDGRTIAAAAPSSSTKHRNFYAETAPTHAVQITSLSYIPGARMDSRYLGNLNVFLIRETSSLREVGGLCSFVQSFVSEIYSIVRSHVSALGGNSVVSYFMSEFVVKHSLHKNQAQCLIHVGGDVVKVCYVPSPCEEEDVTQPAAS